MANKQSRKHTSNQTNQRNQQRQLRPVEHAQRPVPHSTAKKSSTKSKHSRNSTNSLLGFRPTERGQQIIFIFFCVMFIYVGAFVIKYRTAVKPDIHEVTTGQISINNTYTGIALREEEIFYSDYAGNVNYFVRDGERASVGDIVYTVDETGRVSALIESMNSEENHISSTNLGIIKDSLSAYKTAYSNNRFYEIYDLKERIDQVVSDSINENVIKNLDDMIKDTSSENLFRYGIASKTGVVVYNTDGFENKTVEQLVADDFNRDNYQKTNLRAESLVVQSNPVYKLIKSENWKIVIPLTNDQITEQGLNEKKTVQIRFIKTGIITNANFNIVPTAGGTYGVLSLNKFMIRYCNDRFVDVEIISSTASGLKIPVSSIVEKEFFMIPEKYAIVTKENDKEIFHGFMHEYQDRETGAIVSNTYDASKVYAFKDGYYYVDKNDFNFGDKILLQDSNEFYSISEVGMLPGVYTVNKGYAVFRRIEIIEQNQEYAIVKKGISFGLSIYDHIILDGTKVTENQIIY